MINRFVIRTHLTSCMYGISLSLVFALNICDEGRAGGVVEGP